MIALPFYDRLPLRFFFFFFIQSYSTLLSPRLIRKFRLQWTRTLVARSTEIFEKFETNKIPEVKEWINFERTVDGRRRIRFVWVGMRKEKKSMFTGQFCGKNKGLFRHVMPSEVGGVRTQDISKEAIPIRALWSAGIRYPLKSRAGLLQLLVETYARVRLSASFPKINSVV